jgi:hypothetical protein
MQVEVDLRTITCNPNSLDSPDTGLSFPGVGAARRIRDSYRHMMVTITHGTHKSHIGAVKATENREGIDYVVVDTETPPIFSTVILRVDHVRERL